ncbi:MAG: YjgN family protein [Methylophilaceae bacterium]
MDAQSTTQKITPIEFKGKAGEYFGIWIVNLLLSLVTFGIYSAWAKVRRKKYFYNNTLIDNVGFDYHAKPIAILKGRIIAFIFFLGYAMGGQVSPFIPIVCMLIFFIALPWLVVRSSMFNARNTSHRGLRFDFVGKVGAAFRVFFVLPILTVISLWIAAPYVSHQKNKFLMGNHKFGMSQFDMHAKVRSFYKVYWFLILVPLIGVLAAVAIPNYQKYVNKAKAAPHAALEMPFTMGFVDVQSQQKVILAAADDVQKVERVYTDNAPPEPAPSATLPASDATPASSSETSAGPVLVDKVYVETPEERAAQEAAFKAQQAEVQQQAEPQHEKTFEEMMQDRKKAREENFKKMFTNPQAFLGMLGFILVYLVFVFGGLAYIKARIGNLVWNNTTLDKLSFKSTLRARDFFVLYLTNIIAIVCTFGLATPWAQIRLARYRAAKLQIVGDVDFDQFVGDKKAEMKATGEEIADFFDVDLSFG